MQIRYRKITCSCLNISGEVLFLVPIATLGIYEIILFLNCIVKKKKCFSIHSTNHSHCIIRDSGIVIMGSYIFNVIQPWKTWEYYIDIYDLLDFSCGIWRNCIWEFLKTFIKFLIFGCSKEISLEKWHFRHTNR